MVLPESASDFIRFLIHSTPSGSSPLTGSSRISTCGSPSSAAAMPSRWPMPREKPPARLRATSVRPTRASTSSTRDLGRPWLCARHQQVVVGRAAGVHGARLQQRPDLAQRLAQVRVRDAADGRGAGVRAVQSEDQPHRGGLAGAVRAQEAGDPARFDGERQMVHGGLVAVPFGQVVHFDHGSPLKTARDGAGMPPTPPQLTEKALKTGLYASFLRITIAPPITATAT